MRSAIILLVAFLPAGLSLSCIYSAECETCYVPKTCNMTDDVCVTYNTGNSTESRCGKSGECYSRPSMIEMTIKFIIKDTNFNIFRSLRTDTNYLQCCKEDYCNDYLVKKTLENDISALSDIKTASPNSSSIKNLGLRHFSSEVKNLTEMKSSTVLRFKGNRVSKEDSISEIKISNISESRSFFNTTDLNEFNTLNFTSVGEASQGSLIGSSNCYWEFLSHELLVLATLCNLFLFVACFI